MCAKMDPKDVKEFWDNRAKEYGKASLTGITNFRKGKESQERDEIERKALENYLDFGKCRNVLDIGCGIGRLCFYLAEKVDFVAGVDYSKPLIDIAKQELKKRGLKNVDFTCGRCTDFKYPKKFDAVIISGLFTYLNDEEVPITIANAHKHMKKGGIMLLRESIGLEKRFEVIDKYSPALKARYNGIYRTVATLNELFEKQGFRAVHSEKLYQQHKETATCFFVYIKK